MFVYLVAFWVGLAVTAGRQASKEEQFRRQTDRQTVYIHLIYYFQQPTAFLFTDLFIHYGGSFVRFCVGDRLLYGDCG